MQAAVCLLFAVAGTAWAEGITPRGLLADLLQLDADLGFDVTTEVSDPAPIISICETDNSRTHEQCVIRALVRRPLRPSLATSYPRESTVGFALNTGEGTCVALVATILALTERYGSPFDAVVFRDHVVLVSTATGKFYEVLENGRELEETEVQRLRNDTPFPPERVDGRGFIPFYLDNLAVRLAEAGQTGRAREAFRMALDRNARSPRIHYNYGTFLLDRREHDDALKHLTRAIRLGWTGADAFVNRGVALAKLGRGKRARRDFERALRIDPTNREAASNLRALAQHVQRAP